MAPRTERSDGDRMLRTVLIALWLPAFPLLLAHGIRSARLCPALGIIPMTLSLAIGVVHLTGKAQHRGANILVDLFAAIFMIAILIPGWVLMGESSWRTRSDPGITMVGTYGTVPMMANFCIHAYFVLREINWRAPLSLAVCPHCEQRLHEPEGEAMVESKQAYKPLSTTHDSVTTTTTTTPANFPETRTPEPYHDDEDDGARPSTDDETARLV